MPPRLLYLGDVPVESSYHGSTLLYRLFQRYPANRLRIIESNLSPSTASRRLPAVRYESLTVGHRRVLNSRFHSWYSRWLFAGAARRAAQVASRLDGFLPEAVITVAHGFSWVTAAQYAARQRRPLHLICHDDWPSLVALADRPHVEGAFGRVYRQAVARYCISPFMVDEYQRRYGAAGTLLLPSRAADATVFDGPAPRLREQAGRIQVAFAGTVNSAGYARLLRLLAWSLAPLNADVVLFGPITSEQAASAGLDLPNLRLAGLIPSSELLGRLRAEADILFVPMSFAEEDRANMRMGFPSKLTDYTAVGLPLLICGPPDCSAVRWALGHSCVAQVACGEDELGAAVEQLVGDRDLRLELARNAQVAGDQQFSWSAAESVWLEALRAGATSGE